MSESYHIVCLHCSSINRIPTQRLAENPVCGKCKQKLFNGHPVELTADTFLRHINRNDIPVLTDFCAAWCGHCKTRIPLFKHAAKQLEPQTRLIKVNTEREQTLARKYNIRSIPTLVLFKNGLEVARQTGIMSANELVLWVRSKL